MNNRQLLPPNATEAEITLSKSSERISQLKVAVSSLWDPDICLDIHLPWFAWALSVDDWQENWTSEQKRGAIKQSAEIHRKKGTVGAVKQATKIAGFDTELLEWFETIPTTPPHTFTVEVKTLEQGQGFTLESIKTLMSSIANSKRESSHCNVRLMKGVEGSVPLAGKISNAKKTAMRTPLPLDKLYTNIELGGNISTSQKTELMTPKTQTVHGTGYGMGSISVATYIQLRG